MAFYEPDAAFMLHHLAIMSCFFPLFISRRGHVMATVGIAVAEACNPMLGLWSWSKENLKGNTGLSQPEREFHTAIFNNTSLPVTVGYLVARGIVMPLVLVDFGVTLFSKASLLE